MFQCELANMTRFKQNRRAAFNVFYERKTKHEQTVGIMFNSPLIHCCSDDESYALMDS